MAIKLSEKQKKNGWQVVKFAEIAKNVSKRVDPTTTDLKVYVGLEHLDPQSLRIQRKEVPGDVKGQKLRVRPGQIIFGKRRAYQKKMAIADFNGICSAHAMVLEEIKGTGELCSCAACSAPLMRSMAHQESLVLCIEFA